MQHRNSGGTTDRIAYLGPEIPALSATFIHDEILDLRRRGFTVCSYSIHRPAAMARDSESRELARETCYLYEQRGAGFFGVLVRHAALRPRHLLLATAWLIHDVLKTGIVTLQSAKLVYQFMVANLLAADLVEKRVQHLHIHFAHVPTQVGMYGAAIADIPFSFTSHANDLFQHGILLKEKVRRSKKAITISAHNKRFLVAHHADPRHIQIVRCGVTLTPGYTRLAAERDVPVIGSLGRLVEKKGMDTLLRACAELHREGVTFRLQIAGGGPLQKSLQTLAAQLHIGERVEFLGPLDHDRVFAWLEGLDVFALACRKDKNGDTDGIPVVLMEAMVRCVPVVSTAISGIPELIEHNRTGLLSRPEDLNAFTTSLRRILQNRESTAAMAKCGRERIEAEFSRDVNTERLLQIFMS